MLLEALVHVTHLVTEFNQAGHVFCSLFHLLQETKRQVVIDAYVLLVILCSPFYECCKFISVDIFALFEGSTNQL